ncbi:hypothetical protein [Aquimarina algicola]|uniref:Lipoprotein n=1 Tax=Aquimarina algicola TaxID=2589995 RepID=A0A504JEH5_9FLAO|nr:hypothetical protein [Aquimarina algicola]TPN89247.1 hypothetical protein FHK87_03195 [Aquimarina algicola]
MKKQILTVFVCVTLLLVSSCKKDPKSDNLEVVEKVQDSTQIVASETIEEEKPEPQKKKEKKKKDPERDGKKDFERTSKLIPIPGTSDRTENADAKRYIRDYEKYVSNYKKAVEAKDMDSFLKLNDASSSLSKQYNELMTKLSGEEIEKMSKYMQVKSRQLAELSAKM